MTQRPELLPYLVAALAVVGITILAAMQVAVPDILNVVAGGATIGGAAISRSSPPSPPAV